jgi:light-dependent protochlorophyllide reductase
MTMRTVIVTGASAGLGLQCARALLATEPSWHVVMAVRDRARGDAAVAQLGQPRRCTVIEADLASLHSVGAFIQCFKAAGLPPLHAIVCNAGIQVVSGIQLTEDGFEMTFGVNHLGHFALVQGLLDELVAPARIVVVASGVHDPSRHTGMPAPDYTTAAELAAPPGDDGKSVDGRRRYANSKLCNVLFVNELDRRLDHGARGITVNAFDPGMMPGSGLARDYSPLQRFAWRFVLPAMRVLPGVRSTRTSGRHLAALVADPRFEGVTGRYFDGLKDIRSSQDSYDQAKATDLWQTSQRLVSSAVS